MSEKPVQWALQRAPSVPAAKGKPAPASCRAVLIGLAWHADKQGQHAFPAVSTLVAYTDLGERTVRACLDRLAEVGLIRPCDPAVVAAAIPRADRRPDGYDLAVERHRGVQTSQAVEVQTPHPAPDSGVHAPQAEGPNGVQPSQPVETNGVQCMQQRGASTAPERAQERDTPNGVSSAPRAPARTRGTTLTDLADSARTPGAWNLVNAWRLEQSAPYRTATVRALSKQVETILADKGDADAIRDALDAWAARSDAGPGLLPNLYDDALKARHGARPGGRATTGDKAAGWHALGADPNAAVGHSARGDKAAGWLALADEPTTDTPNLTALPGGAA